MAENGEYRYFVHFPLQFYACQTILSYSIVFWDSSQTNRNNTTNDFWIIEHIFAIIVKADFRHFQCIDVQFYRSYSRSITKNHHLLRHLNVVLFLPQEVFSRMKENCSEIVHKQSVSCSRFICSESEVRMEKQKLQNSFFFLLCSRVCLSSHYLGCGQSIFFNVFLYISYITNVLPNETLHKKIRFNSLKEFK